jgi:transposase
MDMIGKIRRMHRRDKKTKREIARATGLSRNTVAKWLDDAQPVEPRYRREAAKATKLSAYEAELKQALKADAKRPKKERRTAKALFAQIKASGYEGGYTRVTDFIRKWRQGEGQGESTKAFVPLTFELGEAFQFDWSEDGLLIGGVYYRLQVSHMKLCASGAFWLVAYPSQGHEMLFDAHTRSFAALGGVARRGIYDNMKTAVDKVKKGKGRVVNARFAAMCSHYLFDADFCNRASGWEKGRVEKDVQDSRRRIWVEAGQRRFGSFAELNAWLGERCRALWQELRHPQHKAFSIAEMLELEQSHLMPMPVAFDGYVENPAKVSSTCLVTVARNRYSVPCEWAGRSCVSWTKSSKSCACTAWQEPGRTWSSKAARPRWRAHAGCWSTCCRQRSPTGPCAQSATRCTQPNSPCIATWRALTSNARQWTKSSSSNWPAWRLPSKRTTWCWWVGLARARRTWPQPSGCQASHAIAHG